MVSVNIEVSDIAAIKGYKNQVLADAEGYVWFNKGKVVRRLKIYD